MESEVGLLLNRHQLREQAIIEAAPPEKKKEENFKLYNFQLIC